jgi:hypothetical protein
MQPNGLPVFQKHLIKQNIASSHGTGGLGNSHTQSQSGRLSKNVMLDDV